MLKNQKRKRKIVYYKKEDKYVDYVLSKTINIFVYLLMITRTPKIYSKSFIYTINRR